MAREGARDRGLFERPDGSGIWWIRYADAHGREHRERVGSKSAARAAYQTRKAAVRQGKFCPADAARGRKDLTLSEAFKVYLPEWAHLASAPEDQRRARRWLKDLGDVPLSSIDAQGLEAWRRKRSEERRRGKDGKLRTIRPATVNRDLAFLRKVLRRAVRDGRLERNPMDAVRQARENNARLRWLTVAEEEALLAHVPEHAKVLVLVAIRTGLRRSEQLGLRRENVDFRTGFLEVPRSKHGEARRVPLSPQVRDLLKLHLDTHTSPWVFPSQQRRGSCLRTDETRPTNARNLCARIFDPAVQAAGLKGVTWHVLRHTFISRLVMQGVDLAMVRELAGHKTMAMTLRYSHLAPGRLQAAIARIDEFRD